MGALAHRGLEKIEISKRYLGIFFGDIDGEMTDETVEAIMEFQHRQGLEETGNYDEDTRAQLEDLHSS